VCEMEIQVCFVCMGNICRSPTAEGIMQVLIEDAGLQGRVLVDSAGISAFHVGGEADPRSVEAARERGVELDGSCRQFEREDLERFDYIVAMDRQNYNDLLSLARDDQMAAKISLLRSFDPSADGEEVPDPYVGARGFDRVFDICDAGCRGLLDHLRERHGLARS
jgi:protein-tyrosine phosphatase